MTRWLFGWTTALLLCTAHPISAGVTTFQDGLATPTGIAVHPWNRELYVNSGASGKVWSIPIQANGTAGTVATVTEAFNPDMDIVFDAAGNLYAPMAASDDIFRLAAGGGVSATYGWVYSTNAMGTGITVESPGTGSSRLFFGNHSGFRRPYLGKLTINNFRPNTLTDYDHAVTCSSFRFLEYRPGVAGIAGTSGNSVFNINPSNGSCSTILSGFVQPNGLAEDELNNLYVADGGTGRITKITPLGQSVVVATGLESPTGLAYDRVGKRLFVSEPSANRISAVTLLSGAPFDGVGLHNPQSGIFYLRNRHGGGAADMFFRFGLTGSASRPISGDWNGNGQSTVGLYHTTFGWFDLRDSHGSGASDASFRFGPTGRNLSPLSGDWNGNGRSTIGLYDATTGSFMLRNALAGGAADASFRFGPAGRNWIPLTGDWNGNGRTTVGLYDPATGSFHLHNSLGGGAADMSFRFGPAGRNWMPLSGDWDGDGRSSVGLYDPSTGTYYLRNGFSGGAADVQFRFGPAPSTWTPLSGIWQPTGTASSGTVPALLEIADSLTKDATLSPSRGLERSELPTALQALLTEAQAEVWDAHSGADEGWIVFATDSALVAEDRNGVTDVYGYDPLLETLALISRDSEGRAGNGASFGPHLDGAGMRIVFVSEASNLVAEDTNGVADVFVHEPALSHTLRVSTSSFGEAADGASHRARLSADGDWVVFFSDAGNLAEGEPDDEAEGEPDDEAAVFVHEVASGLTRRIQDFGEGLKNNVKR
ncbi:hypothetical protein [Thiocapsa rosea]|uniref:Uncharacterized protein n=1 Tax=Thiocapsa rosea TaxID=69360 RepID=A0A495V4Z1_9GAMM|nr:hypothetical protein [Thiocapsa rosea]RKT44466.1 hypothetical protein BDD21_1850 [Thiocapsa rosea]